MSRTRCNLNSQCSRRGKCVYSSFTSATCECTLSSGTHCESCELGKIESLYDGGDGLQSSVAPKCRSCTAGLWSDFVGYSSNITDCTECQPGRAFGDSVVLGTNATDCFVCEKGQYQSEAGQTVCLKCNPGMYGIYGRSFEILKWTEIIPYEIAGSFRIYSNGNCTGSFTTPPAEMGPAKTHCNNGNTILGSIPFVPGQCAVASPGFWFLIICPTTNYTTEKKTMKKYLIPTAIAATKCLVCDVGQYQNVPGSTNCTLVTPGYQNTEGYTTQVRCNAGRYGKDGTCIDCVPGSTRAYVDPPELCIQCKKGTYSNKTGGAACYFCDLGKYQNKVGSLSCVTCPDNTYRGINNLNASKCYTCSGTDIPNFEKTACGRPTYLTAADCDIDLEYLNATSKNNNDHQCIACPDGAYCHGDTTFKDVIPKFGYSRCHSDPSLFSSCMFSAACLGGLNLKEEKKYKTSELNTSMIHFRNETCNIGYKPNSQLCSICDKGYSHKGLTGRCDKCPSVQQNYGIAGLGVLGGIAGLFVFTRITLSDQGNIDAADGMKSIGMSFIQLLSLMTTFPIAWPDFVTNVFKIGGAITVLGAHLVDYKCMVDTMTDADVFYAFVTVWAILPFILVIAVVGIWIFVAAPLCVCFSVTELRRKITISVVALLYLLYPTLCSTIFSLLACRKVCSSNQFLLAALDEPCWEGRHGTYALFLGLPMFLVFVFGLPLISIYRVYFLRKGIEIWKEQAKQLEKNNKIKENGNESKQGHHRFWSDVNVMTDIVVKNRLLSTHQAFGLLYTSYRDDVWWWEVTVALRKVVVACIGVFGASLGEMQVHLVLLYVFFNAMITALVRPFGGSNANILQKVELICLVGLFLTLWSGSIFNTYPKCLDRNGNVMQWCTMLSLFIGIFNIAVVLGIGGGLYIIKKSQKKQSEQKITTTNIFDEVNPAFMPDSKHTSKQKKNNDQKEAASTEIELSSVAAIAINVEPIATKTETTKSETKLSSVAAIAINVEPIATKTETTQNKKISKLNKKREKKGYTKKKNNKKKKKKQPEEEEHHRSSTSLPDGWTKVISNGKKYYANRKTQESSWKPPVGSTGGSSGNN